MTEQEIRTLWNREDLTQPISLGKAFDAVEWCLGEIGRLGGRLAKSEYTLQQTEKARDVAEAVCREMLESKTLDRVKDQRNKAEEREKDLRRQLAEAEADHARYVERHDKTIDWWRDAVDKVEADNAALREALELADGMLFDSTGDFSRDWSVIKPIVDNALSQPHPGAKMLEKLAAMRKVAEAAWLAAEVIDPRLFVLNTGKFYREELMSALTALDALNTQEAPNA